MEQISGTSNQQLASGVRWASTCCIEGQLSCLAQRLAGENRAMAIEVQGVAPLVQVFDMPRSIHFYRDLLGFKLTGKSKEKSGDPDDVDWAMLQLSTATIMLNTAYDPEDVPLQPDAARWSGHQDTCLYFGCPDLEGAYRQLVSRGLQLDPPKVAWYGMKQLYLKDPDGFGICFQWFA